MEDSAPPRSRFAPVAAAKRRLGDLAHIHKRVITAHPADPDPAPETVIAGEQYRLLRTRVLQIARRRRSNIFLVTSALPGDGKTLTSLNLSFSLAQLADKRVLYVELDLRRPSAHTVLGIRSEPEDHTFLELRRPWPDCVRPLNENLDGLLAFNPSRTPNETLHLPEVASFLAEAADAYDVVVLDTAPLLATVDTQVLLPLVSNVLLVVFADKTPIDCVRDALALVGDKAVGVVLNGAQKVKYREHYYGYATESYTAPVEESR